MGSFSCRNFIEMDTLMAKLNSGMRMEHSHPDHCIETGKWRESIKAGHQTERWFSINIIEKENLLMRDSQQKRKMQYCV